MNPLAELKDIHMAPVPSWWPLAPGWWLLLIFLVLLTSVGIYLFQRYRQYKKRKAKQRHILNEFEQVYLDYSGNGHVGDLVNGLHQLIRRLMLASGAQKQVGLTGEAFLIYLDEGMDEKPFSAGVGRTLVDAPYQPEPSLQAEPLYELVYAWAERKVQK